MEESITTVELNLEKCFFESSFPSSITTIIGKSKCNEFVFCIHSISIFVKITAETAGKSVCLISISSRVERMGNIFLAEDEKGVPFAAVCKFLPQKTEKLEKMDNIEELKTWLTLRIEEDFGLNSMYAVRIDGEFSKVDARSESGTKAHHVTLKDALSVTQKAFVFENIRGSLVCVYYPDYMDGINAEGWHLHFLSEDRKHGGHVFDLSLTEGSADFCRITSVEIKIPDNPAFDTYALKRASKDDIKSVEQGKK